jgi:CheY-like chemotaxis protein
VLVVDDDALSRALLADALAGRGFGVVAERDALAGLLRLAEEIFSLDVLVTDVVMPEVDGEELVRRVREVGGERDLPIVAVTASEDPGLAARLRACGVDAVLAKRIGPEGIADAVVKVHRAVRTVPRTRRARAPEPTCACR